MREGSYNSKQKREALAFPARFRWACVFLFLFVFTARARAQAPDNRGTATAAPASIGSNSQFAIADFDGDRRPDLARVEAGSSSSNQTQYWIQLQLSQAGRQLIGVVAPMGGLQVAASDVNGDHAVDLVLSTAWLNRPVAILLNDGHGRFTAEEPSAFPGAFRRAAENGLSHRQHAIATASATQSRAGVYWEAKFAHALPQKRARLQSNFARFSSPSLLPQRGRAPPLS